MKTVLEWYNKITDPKIRAKALMNYDPSFACSSNRQQCSSLADAFQNGFLWSDSPEGDHYWCQIFESTKSGRIKTTEYNFEL